MHKAGFVTILGNPNVGKSTLMNELVGESISIINQKAQTTRHKIVGLISEDNFQIVFLDTPGVVIPHHDLHKSMMNTLHRSIEDADIILYVVDCSMQVLKNKTFFQLINSFKKPIFLIINKIDLVDQSKLTRVVDFWTNKIVKP